MLCLDNSFCSGQSCWSARYLVRKNLKVLTFFIMLLGRIHFNMVWLTAHNYAQRSAVCYVCGPRPPGRGWRGFCTRGALFSSFWLLNCPAANYKILRMLNWFLSCDIAENLQKPWQANGIYRPVRNCSATDSFKKQKGTRLSAVEQAPMSMQLLAESPASGGVQLSWGDSRIVVDGFSLFFKFLTG